MMTCNIIIYVNMRDIIMLHVTCDCNYVFITMLRVDKIYPAYKGQRYATILFFK